jgi:DNA topoisomerase IA
MLYAETRLFSPLVHNSVCLHPFAEKVARLTGLQVIKRNYLDVFPYDKWIGKHIPGFNEGEQFMPSVCELREGLTTRPALLTEADLVGLMDKNGIG